MTEGFSTLGGTVHCKCKTMTSELYGPYKTFITFLRKDKTLRYKKRSSLATWPKEVAFCNFQSCQKVGTTENQEKEKEKETMRRKISHVFQSKMIHCKFPLYCSSKNPILTLWLYFTYLVFGHCLALCSRIALTILRGPDAMQGIELASTICKSSVVSPHY